MLTSLTQPEFSPRLADTVLAPAQYTPQKVRNLVVVHPTPVILDLQAKVSLLGCLFTGLTGGPRWSLLGAPAPQRCSSAPGFEELGVLGDYGDSANDIEFVPVEFFDVYLDSGQDTDGFAGILKAEQRYSEKQNRTEQTNDRYLHSKVYTTHSITQNHSPGSFPSVPECSYIVTFRSCRILQWPGCPQRTRPDSFAAGFLPFAAWTTTTP
jgi:hypothetical protein